MGTLGSLDHHSETWGLNGMTLGWQVFRKEDLVGGCLNAFGLERIERVGTLVPPYSTIPYHTPLYTLPYHALPYRTLHSTLPYPPLPYPTLTYPTLHPNLPYHTLPYPTLHPTQTQ